MTLSQVAIAHLVKLAIALALAGLVLRGRVRLCRFFSIYLAFVLVCDLLLALSPRRFWVWPFWLFRQTVTDVLKIVIALELGYWIFLGFPGAAQNTRRVILALLGTLLAVLTFPNDASRDSGGFLFGAFRPRLEIGAAWLFTALAGLVQWYRIPLHPVHRGIMIGFVPYLVVFGAMMRLVVDYGWSEHLVMLQPLAFLASCSWWTWMAWRRDVIPEADPLLVARLQPWRVRC